MTLRRLQYVVMSIGLPLALVFIVWISAQPAAGAACAVPGTYATIQAAANDANCDLINIAAGTYHENLVLTRTVSLQGAGRDVTIIDGNQAGHVVHIEPPLLSGHSFTITDVTIQDGLADRGGGIRIDGGNRIHFADMNLQHNEAEFGGGLYVDEVGHVTLDNVLVLENYSNDVGGGGGIYSFVPMTIRHSQILSNTTDGLAIGKGGAGINNRDDITVTHTLIAHNVAEHEGGGFYDASTVTNVRLIAVTVEDNQGQTGGGIHIATNGNFFMQDSIVRNNSTPVGNLGSGGGINMFGSNLTITNTVIEENYADWGGGGIAVASGGSLTLFNTLVQSNTAEQQSGGGINFAGASLTVRESAIYANRASSGSGGGILTIAATTIADTRIYSNTAASSGGGLSHSESTPGYVLTMTSSSVYSNVAGTGGGGVTINGHGSMTNVTISQNRAGSGTGGLDHGGIDTAFRLDSVTVASNHSDGSVGGVTNILSQILITNSILISNTNPSSEWDCAGVFVSGGYNLVGATGGTCNSIDDFNQPSDIVNVPGLLQVLQENGGFGPTHMPRFGVIFQSPAVDGGGLCPAVDQRGAVRPFNGDSSGGAECDIGAVERRICPPPVIPDVAITTETSDVHLTWDENGANRLFMVYEAADPFPTSNPDAVQVSSQAAYTDYGVIPDGAGSHFYVVRAENPCGVGTTVVKKGFFNFEIVPGS